MVEKTPLLELRGISKRFGLQLAVDSVDFDLPLDRSLFTGLEVRFWISGSDGSLYQRTGAIGASIGF